MKSVPNVNWWYWIALSAASVFGANAGDFLSDVLNLGHTSGLPALALVLAAVFVAERFAPAGAIFFYWAAIITIRAAATNIGDCLHDLDVAYAWSIPAVAIALSGWTIVWRLRRKPEAGKSVPVNGYYWIAMGLAGVLGTLIGDCFSYGLGLGNFAAMIALGAPLLLALAIGRTGIWNQLPYYWATIVLVRSAGTAAGDLIAHTPLDLTGATLTTGAVFVALIIAFYGRMAGNVAHPHAVPTAA